MKINSKPKKDASKKKKAAELETITLDNNDLEILTGEELDFIVGGGGSRPRSLAI